MDPLASLFFSDVRAETAKKAMRLPVSDLATRTARLAHIQLRLAKLSYQIGMTENDLRMKMSEGHRLSLQADLARFTAEREALRAERTHLHQNPPQGREQRLAELHADISAIRESLAAAGNAWLREVNQSALCKLQLEMDVLDKAIHLDRMAAVPAIAAE